MVRVVFTAVTVPYRYPPERADFHDREDFATPWSRHAQRIVATPDLLRAGVDGWEEAAAGAGADGAGSPGGRDELVAGVADVRRVAGVRARAASQDGRGVPSCRSDLQCPLPGSRGAV